MNKFIKEEKLWIDGTDITNCLVAYVLNGDQWVAYNVEFLNIMGEGKTRKDQLKSIIKQEEYYIIQSFMDVLKHNIGICGNICIEDIQRLMTSLEENMYVARKFLINKKYMINCNDINKKNIKKHIFNAEIIYDKRLKNYCFVIPEPEFVGIRILSKFGIIEKGKGSGKLFCKEAISIIHPRAIVHMQIMQWERL